MKRLITTLLLLCFGMSLVCIPASAKTEKEITHVFDTREIEANEQCYVSDIMTYDEMRTRCAELSGNMYNPETDAEREFALRHEPGYREVSIQLDVADKYKPSLVLFFEVEQNGQYWAIKSLYSIQMNREYRYGDGNDNIISVAKQFSGDIEVWVRSIYEVEYVVNGDFYNYGTTTSSGGMGVDIGIGEVAKVSFNASQTVTSNHYKYFYEHKMRQVLD